MYRIIILTIFFLSSTNNFGQEFKKVKSKNKHADKIIAIATNDEFFATCSYDKSLIVWSYDGKVVFKHKLADGKINSMSFMKNSNSLLVGLTIKDNSEIKSHIIKCLDITGTLKFELVDTSLTQEQVDKYYEKNTTSAQNAIKNVSDKFPELDIKKEIGTPQTKYKLSHFELVQDIEVSPNNISIASIDKFNILKIWDTSGELMNSSQIINNKKNTEIYYLSDSTLFVTPNLILDIETLNIKTISGFEKYSSIPFGDMIYFYFDYNNESRQEKLYNIKTSELEEFDSKRYYTSFASKSNDKLALLGFNGLINVIDQKGELLSSFGKDRNESTTFRGEKFKLFSKICKIGFSPNGKYIISGNETGKVIIWSSK